jgi:two-component system, cell cycle sensor histidine kinase and response regulator CckA
LLRVEKHSTRRPWLMAHASFPDALARIRRDGLVLETFLPAGMGTFPPEQRWVGRTLAEILGEEAAAPWLERIRAALDVGCFTSDRFSWTQPNSPLVFEVRLVPLSADEVLSISREVGYQERLEADRNAMHELLQRATDLMPDVVYVFDYAADRVVFQNRSIAEDLGYSPEQVEALGPVPTRALCHPDDLATMPEILARVIAASDDEVFRYEGRWRAPDGSWRWYLVHFRVFARQADGTPHQVVGVMRDVTERRTLQRRLERAAKLDALGIVAGSVAHDFNNSLTAIHGFAELLRPAIAASGRDDYDWLLSAIEGAKGIASRVLSFSRAENRRLESVNLAQLVRKAEPMLVRMLGADIELALELPDEQAVVRADPHELEQAIVNLALNARDAMPQGGLLRVRVEVDAPAARASFTEEGGRAVRLLVTDTGEGMSRGVQRRAFQPFFTTKARGTGLGLASARLAIEYAGGTLDVESAPGRGTTFVAKLPWCATPPLASEQRDEKAHVRAGAVLVVDDEPMVLRLMGETLRRAGHVVRTASDHHGALTIASDGDTPIDLLISDVVMPGMTGPELASRIRTLRPGLPVLFVSGFQDEPALVDAAGAPLLRKPFSPRQLTESAARLLAAGR